MAATTMSSRDFNQNASGAKRAASNGPVFITDRGVPAHVLLSISDYRRLVSGQSDAVDALGSPPGIEDAALDIATPRDTARAAAFN